MSDQVTNTQHMVEEVHQPDPGHAESGNPLLAMDPGMVFWTWLIFFIFLFVLRKYAWKPILDSLDERESSIEKALEDAEAARLAMEKASEEQRQLIQDGRQAAAASLDAARGTASAAADDTLKQARGEAQKMVDDAQAEVAEQKDAAMKDLRATVGDLSVMVASKLLSTDLDDDRSRDLVKGYIAEVSG